MTCSTCFCACTLAFILTIVVRNQDAAEVLAERAFDYYMGGYAIRDAEGMASGCNDVGKTMCIVRSLLHAYVCSSDRKV